MPGEENSRLLPLSSDEGNMKKTRYLRLAADTKNRLYSGENVLYPYDILYLMRWSAWPDSLQPIQSHSL